RAVVLELQKQRPIGGHHAGKSADDAVVDVVANFGVPETDIESGIEDFEKMPELEFGDGGAKSSVGFEGFTVALDIIGVGNGIEAQIAYLRSLCQIGGGEGARGVITISAAALAPDVACIVQADGWSDLAFFEHPALD